MKVLVLLTDDAPRELARRVTEAHARAHEVTVVDLAGEPLAYDAIVDAICGHDRVIAW